MVWPAVVSGATVADVLHGHVATGLLVDGLVPAGLYHGVKHAHRLPYHLALRYESSPQRDAQRGCLDAVYLHGTDDAGGLVGKLWRECGHRLLAVVRAEVCSFLRPQHRPHPQGYALLSAPLFGCRHAVHLRAGGHVPLGRPV